MPETSILRDWVRRWQQTADDEVVWVHHSPAPPEAVTPSAIRQRECQEGIKTALRDAAYTHGVHDKAVEDVVRRGLAVFTDLDQDGQVIAKHGENVVYGQDGITPLSPDEWVRTLKASGTVPHLWSLS